MSPSLSEQEPASTSPSAAAEDHPTPVPPSGVHHLLAYPLESNFDGARHSAKLPAALRAARTSSHRLGWHERRVEQVGASATTAATSGSWWTCVDAAKHAATSPLDLDDLGADFVVVSFYKIFGYPTGF
jgi:hypothetical protein